MMTTPTTEPNAITAFDYWRLPSGGLMDGHLREARQEIARLRAALVAVKKVVTARRKQHYWDDLVKIIRLAETMEWEEPETELGVVECYLADTQADSRNLEATVARLSADTQALREELKKARYLARVLASAWEHDARPPTDVVKDALEFEVDQR